MYTLVLGENNAADQTKAMQDQMSGAAMSAPDDINKAFKVKSKFKIYFYIKNIILLKFILKSKAEGDSLSATYHNWALKGIEQNFLEEMME